MWNYFTLCAKAKHIIKLQNHKIIWFEIAFIKNSFKRKLDTIIDIFEILYCIAMIEFIS